MKERVQKLMAQAHIGSRRASEKIIEAGRVRVNGKVITLGDKADPEVDIIEVDGRRIHPEAQEKRYIVFYKPPDILSTNKKSDPNDSRQTVLDVIPIEGHYFTIGRLDANSEGLIVLTNDGELANRLAHPRYEHTKTYKVIVKDHPTEDTLDKWQNGVWMREGKSAPCYVKVLTSDSKTTTLRIVMIEGRKRQIRRVARQLGHPVVKLMRTHIGQLGMGTLRRGEYYELDSHEVESMTAPAEELKFIKRRQKQQRRKKNRSK